MYQATSTMACLTLSPAIHCSRARDLPALEDAEPAFMAWLQQHGLPEQQVNITTSPSQLSHLSSKHIQQLHPHSPAAVLDTEYVHDQKPSAQGSIVAHAWSLIVSQLVAQQVEGQGRCLVAKAPIRKGQQLLCVPEQLLITPSLAASGKEPAEAWIGRPGGSNMMEARLTAGYHSVGQHPCPL